MISKELARKIRYIEIYTSKAVNDSLAGDYQSVFKGRGMEFNEVREYQPGDEVRSIDWNVTARMGHPYIKRFIEERELTVIFLVDVSASGSFGSCGHTKNEVAAEICALLAFSAVKNNDKTGLILFTDRIEKFVPADKGSSHVLRLVRELLFFRPRGTGTNIADALDYLGRVANKRSVVFLVSDFLAEGYAKRMRTISKHHDLVAVSITDPRELLMPSAGLLDLEDAESGRTALVDTGRRSVARAYRALTEERRTRRNDIFRSAGVDHIEVVTDRDYLRQLVRFFKARERRARR